MFDTPSQWDSGFKSIWESTKLKWVEPLRMSPKGLWDNLYERCGPAGSNILHHFPDGTNTNPDRLFPAKPKSFEYARQIVNKSFWL